MPGKERATGTSTEMFVWETVAKGEKAQLGNIAYFVDDVARSTLGSAQAFLALETVAISTPSNSLKPRLQLARPKRRFVRARYYP